MEEADGSPHSSASFGHLHANDRVLDGLGLDFAGFQDDSAGQGGFFDIQGLDDLGELDDDELRALEQLI